MSRSPNALCRRAAMLAWLAAGVGLGMGLSACDAGGPGDLDSTDTRDDATCQQQQNEWLLYDYAPLLCEDGPDCVGQVSLDTRPTCDGEPDYDTWTLVWDKHVYTPMMLRRNQAREAYMLASSPAFLDRDRFITDSAPTAAMRAAHDRLIQIPHSGDAFDFTTWMGRYVTVLSDVAFPLYSQSANSIMTAGEGRLACGDPIDADLDFCDSEPALYIDPSEEAVLSMFEDFEPQPAEDGAYVSWVDSYYDALTGWGDLMSFDFPLYTNRGLADYELAFFRGLRAIRPRPAGPRDVSKWLGYAAALIAAMDASQSDQTLQVELFFEARPDSDVGGPEAYGHWLGVSELDIGWSTFTDDPDKLALWGEAKPCARNQDELADMNAAFADYSARSGDGDLAAATPALCE